MQDNFCTSTSAIWQFVGYGLYALKILIPTIIIIMGIMDFAKATISNDDKALTNSLSILIKRIVAGVVIFFIPTIVTIAINLISEAANLKNKITGCYTCLLTPTSNGCNDIKQLAIQEKNNRNDINENTGVNQTNKHPEYKVSNSHTNSINGIKYVLYNQCTEPWGSKIFMPGQTVCQGGCPMIAAAVIISAYDFDLTPDSIYNNGLKHDFISTIVDKLAPGAFTCSSVYPKTEDNIINELADGDVIVMRRQLHPETQTGNHWMALIDVKKNSRQVFIGNSFGNGNSPTNRSGWFNISQIVINPQEVFVCKPSQTLIDRFK